MPSVLQLYDPESGNPDLDPERCWCVEVGVEQKLPRDTTIAVAGFWQDLTDFIERDADRIFENRQELRLTGVEVSTTTRPFEPLSLHFAYSYLHTADLSSDRTFPRLANRPRHTIDSEVRYDHPWHGYVRVALRYLRGIEQDSRNEPYELMTLDDFTTVDAHVSQRLFDGRVELYFGVDNVFDADGAVNFGFPLPGRTVLGGFRLRI
jgi:iron complex outermembrane receptor protein